ncbi:type VI immunity family protein [Xenorhabdus szentirmaii]|uniref:Uncharacterized protein n=1 Tax=Xenorhabdus szentirmaii DSM 16338 TaxID=1427518 RepID=W1ITC6_9GAMM|nr:type VI immunity family protein [Xenorhabdus szentirmaii]CDL81078.1 conserved hypothetical protein [Xenorhabdus szentirmaii DSM 16338]
MGSPADWYEYIHGRVSYFSFYLPLSKLKAKGGIYLEDLLNKFCIILNPMHGLAGLGIQQGFERERYQHLEYEIGQEFLGVDITNSNTNKHNRHDLRSINWFTFIMALSPAKFVLIQLLPRSG